METRTIVIKRKKVECLVLRHGMIRKPEDVYIDGTPIVRHCIGRKDALMTYRPIKPASKPKAKGRTTPRISFTGELSQDGGTSFQLPFKNMKKLWPRGIPPARERLVRITLSPITPRKGKK